VNGDPTTDITATRAITDVWRHGTQHPRGTSLVEMTGPAT
jgi:hypothetical protein